MKEEAMVRKKNRELTIGRKYGGNPQGIKIERGINGRKWGEKEEVGRNEEALQPLRKRGSNAGRPKCWGGAPSRQDAAERA
jgi:hypothetical protein